MAKLLGRSSPEPFEEPAVNLTPLIDVVFVILIGFILIAPLLEVDKIELANAPSNAQHPSISIQEASPVSLHVQRNNTILFRGKALSQEELEDALVSAKKEYPNATPQLFHDKAAHFGTYQNVKNALESAGFEQLDIVLSP